MGEDGENDAIHGRGVATTPSPPPDTVPPTPTVPNLCARVDLDIPVWQVFQTCAHPIAFSLELSNGTAATRVPNIKPVHVPAFARSRAQVRLSA
ncbi:hypothetical protein AAHC03_01240 [Spirometra sp. Aus1]